MDRKRRVFLMYCILCSIAVLCVIMLISFIFVVQRYDISTSNEPFNSNADNNKSLSDIEYNTNHYSSSVHDIPESRWNMNDVEHHLRHDKFQFSNGMYLGKNDKNYLVIDDENINQIDHGKRAKVKEVNFFHFKTFMFYDLQNRRKRIVDSITNKIRE